MGKKHRGQGRVPFSEFFRSTSDWGCVHTQIKAYFIENDLAARQSTSYRSQWSSSDSPPVILLVTRLDNPSPGFNDITLKLPLMIQMIVAIEGLGALNAVVIAR